MPFSFGQRLGIFFMVEAACLSAASVTFILFLALYKWLRRTVRTWGKPLVRQSDATDSSLFLNLMFADLIQAIGALISVKWMSDAEITEGSLCTAQAAIKQVGIVGVAMTSLAIAVHTFSVLVLRWRVPEHVSKFVVVGIWFFVALVIGIPNIVHRNEKYYGGTEYWCWIVTEFKTEQIVTEYLWVWFAGFSMVILYTIMFAIFRGWFTIEDSTPESEEEPENDSKAVANLMLFYPAVYIVCVFPNSLSRWLFFSGKETSYQFTLFASTLYALSGMFNLILFFVTRPALVVGPSVVVEESAPLPLHRRSSSHGTRGLGHLPERTSDTTSSLNPRLLTDQNTLTNSPVSRYGSLPTPTPGRGHTIERLSVNPSGPHRRSRGSSTLMEEEDYGHLPG